jgi:hypothetical protein
MRSFSSLVCVLLTLVVAAAEFARRLSDTRLEAVLFPVGTAKQGLKTGANRRGVLID